MRILVTSASGANGNGYGAVLGFGPEGDFTGPFSSDPRVADERRRCLVQLPRLDRHRPSPLKRKTTALSQIHLGKRTSACPLSRARCTTGPRKLPVRKSKA